MNELEGAAETAADHERFGRVGEDRASEGTVVTVEPKVAAYLAGLPSAAGKRVVVTGANTGIGLEAVRLLASRGAEVVLTARDVTKGEAARRGVLAAVPGADISVEQLDLASLAGVRAFAEKVLAGGAVDVLIANAGVMALPRSVTEDGFETQFGVNHLGHFALTGLLLPALRERPGARVVVMTSAAAFSGRIDFGDLMGESDYNRWRAYSQAKLANLLFARALARKFEVGGLSASAHAAHPGLVLTNLQRRVVNAADAGAPQPGQAEPLHMSLGERIFLERLTPLFGQGAQMGALPGLFAALSASASSGDLWGPRWLHARGAPVVMRGPARGFDHELQDRLWAVSQELTGVSYF